MAAKANPAHCIIMERRHHKSEPETYLETVYDHSRESAIRTAIQRADDRGHQVRPVMVVQGLVIVGTCQECGDPVYPGGRARSRHGEIRCWECGGGW